MFAPHRLALAASFASLVLVACSDDAASTSGAGSASSGAGGETSSSSSTGSTGVGGGATTGAGGGAATSTSGTGGCAPTACYSGPAGTEGIGACKGGEQACNSTVCEGEVVPGFDDCTSIADEDCDGVEVACTGVGLWSRALGGNIYDYATGVSVAASNAVFVTGHSSSFNADLGGPQATDTDSYDAYVAKYDAAGAYLWGSVLVVPGDQAGQYVVATPDDGALLVGTTSSDMDLGAGTLTGPGTFLARFDAAGALLWSRMIAYPGCTGSSVPSPAVGPDGSIVLYGCFTDSAPPDLGAGALTPKGVENLFVAKLDAAGVPLFQKVFAWGGSQGGGARDAGVAVDGQGAIALVGHFAGTLDWGSGPAPQVQGAFFAKLDAAGEVVFARSNTESSPSLRVAASPSGDLIVAVAGGSGSGDFGGGVVGHPSYVLRFDAAGMQQAVFGYDPIGLQIQGVSVDAAGNALLGGYWYGQAPPDFGLGPLPASSNGWVLKLDKSLNVVWQAIGDSLLYDTLVPAAGALSTGGDGRTAVAGYFIGIINFGSGDVTSHNQGNQDGFVAVLAP